MRAKFTIPCIVKRKDICIFAKSKLYIFLSFYTISAEIKLGIELTEVSANS